jgi:hypothetical protein
MRVHHAYIGLVLVVWSLLAHFYRIGVIGEYNVYFSMFCLSVGVFLIVHDVWWHLTHRR